MTVSEIIRKELESFVSRTKENMIANRQVATGSMLKSFRVGEVNDDGGKVLGHPFFSVLETGRKPGKQPPVSAILPWVKADNLEQLWGEPEKSIAFVIARYIGKEGTTLWRRGGRKDIVTNEWIETQKRITETLNKYYRGIIQSSFQKLE